MATDEPEMIEGEAPYVSIDLPLPDMPMIQHSEFENAIFVPGGMVLIKTAVTFIPNTKGKSGD